MPYDGSAWDETTPTNSDLANEIDDIARDIKQGVRARMAQEHVFPSSQAATSAAGFHKFVTFQAQSAAPALVYGTATQVGAVFIDSSSKALMFEDSAGNTYTIAQSGVGPLPLFNGTGTIGSIPYATSSGGMVQLVASATNNVLVSNGATVAPSYKALSSFLVITSGQAADGATISLPAPLNSNEVQAIMVSIAANTSAFGTSNPDGIATLCSVNASRVVTAKWLGINGSGTTTGTATANYVLIGIVTH